MSDEPGRGDRSPHDPAQSSPDPARAGDGARAGEEAGWAGASHGTGTPEGPKLHPLVRISIYTGVLLVVANLVALMVMLIHLGIQGDQTGTIEERLLALNESPPAELLLAAYAAVAPIAFLWTWLFRRGVDRRSFTSLGFPMRRVRSLIPGLVIGMLAPGVTVLPGLLFGVYRIGPESSALQASAVEVRAAISAVADSGVGAPAGTSAVADSEVSAPAGTSAVADSGVSAPAGSSAVAGSGVSEVADTPTSVLADTGLEAMAEGNVLGGGLAVLPLLLLLFGGFLLQSATEELVLRGYVQRNMIEWKGASRNLVWILIVPSLLFSISHGFNPDYSALAAVNTVLIGVLFGAIVLANGSLWGAIGIHTGWNFGLGCLWSLPVSGLWTPRLIEMRIDETGSAANFFFGGDYGPEGGLIVTGLVIAGIVWALPRAMRRWYVDQWGTQSHPVA